MLEGNLRNGDALRKRITARQTSLITAMTEILDSVTEPPQNQRDIMSTQARKLRVDMQTLQLVRGCEDLLVLVRGMQEAWLFGKLDTLKKEDGETASEEDGQAIMELLRRLDTLNGTQSEKNRGEP